MRLKRENDILRFTFKPMEVHLLQEVFRQLAESYRLKPDEIDPRTAEAWYSKRGCLSAKLSEEETREWLAHLHELKGENLRHIESWSKQIGESGANQATQLIIKTDDAPAFMTTINDHRLMAASRHDIGQREMDIRSPLQLAQLSAERQMAMLEIHFLAQILEETLRVVEEP
jgi:hypothetical protein